MATATATAPATQATITLDHASKTPLYVQLCDALRSAIERGVYPIGSTLPGLKSLATEFAVSESTVRRAVQKLASEGRLAGNAASGFKVIAIAAFTDQQPAAKKRSRGS